MSGIEVVGLKDASKSMMAKWMDRQPHPLKEMRGRINKCPEVVDLKDASEVNLRYAQSNRP